MIRWMSFFVVFAAFSSLFAFAQEKDTCNYVVREASFENTRGLSPEQVEKLQTQVVGRCYDPVKSVFISQYVYDQLREWGYCKATVYDPNDFRILDPDVRPSPIAVAIDFLLTTPDAHSK